MRPPAALLLIALAACSARGPQRATGALADTDHDLFASALEATTPERTHYLETSRYEDVVDFVHMADAASPDLHSTTFGYSMEGRALPLVVAGAPSASATDVRATGLTRVLVQANIHAGEVEGKEVVQMLLRELVDGQHRDWTDSLTLLFVPIYNADGNERVRLDNRAEQNGPFAGVGTRENAQGLDLNRDHTKLDSPEARSLIRLIDEYDPHVVVDLHTTDGSYHAYHLTYSPPLNPATDSTITTTLRERWLPDVTREMRADGWLAWYYGNLPIREWGMTGERGWYTFDYRPRFNTHYVGMRNRFGILSEAYSYASFEDRIAATHSFVDHVLDWATTHATEIRRTTEAADALDLRGARLPLRAELASSGDTTILLGVIEERVNRYSGRTYAARQDVALAERMSNFDHFDATESEIVPVAYVVPAQLVRVADLLRAHGIALVRWRAAFVPRTLNETSAAPVGLEVFSIDSTSVASREFQGHLERQVFGRWMSATEQIEEDDLIVLMDQPLARLAFVLLEARSPDGVLNWGLLDAQIEAEATRYPIRRLTRPLNDRRPPVDDGDHN